VNDGWEPPSLGDERLDGQHRLLLRRLRAVAAAAGGGQMEEVRRSLRILSVSLPQHLRDEERWMEDAGYPAISEHSRRHHQLLSTLDRATHPQTVIGAARAASDLAKAIEEHMRVDDLKLGRFFAARENFRAMAEARPGLGPALTPIPGGPAVPDPAAPGRTPPLPRTAPPGGKKPNGG
jgi:hemerythrin-like metal-binding protein